MRKGRNGEKKKTGKTGGEKKEKRLMIIAATTSLPAVDRPNANRWNATRSYQLRPFPFNVQMKDLINPQYLSLSMMGEKSYFMKDLADRWY